jgi:hypothetical protein
MPDSNRVGPLESLRHPLAFYGLVVLVVESIIAVLATLQFSDNQVLLFWIFMALIFTLLVTVVLVSIMVARYPRQLMGRFEEVTEAILRGLSEFDRRAILEIDRAGQLSYGEADKDRYKDLRNRGLVRTASRKAMRHDDSLVLTELGALFAAELKGARGGAGKKPPSG